MKHQTKKTLSYQNKHELVLEASYAIDLWKRIEDLSDQALSWLPLEKFVSIRFQAPYPIMKIKKLFELMLENKVKVIIASEKNGLLSKKPVAVVEIDGDVIRLKNGIEFDYFQDQMARIWFESKYSSILMPEVPELPPGSENQG